MDKYLVIICNGNKYRLAKLRIQKDEFYWFGPGIKKPIKLFDEKTVGKPAVVNEKKMRDTDFKECHFSWHKDGEMHLAVKDSHKNPCYESIIKGLPMKELKIITPFAVFIPAKTEYYTYKDKYRSKALMFTVDENYVDRIAFEFAICPNNHISNKMKKNFCNQTRVNLTDLRNNSRYKSIPENYFFRFSDYTLYVGVYPLLNKITNKHSQFYTIYVAEK